MPKDRLLIIRVAYIFVGIEKSAPYSCRITVVEVRGSFSLQYIRCLNIARSTVYLLPTRREQNIVLLLFAHRSPCKCLHA